MPVFPSNEWIDAFCVELTRHPDAAEAATRLDGVYRFVVDPGGALRERHTYAVRLTPRDGGARADRIEDTGSPRVTVRTDYPRWRQLLEGRLNLGAAMLFGHLRIGGDMGALLRSGGDLDVLVAALRGVETTWLDTVA